MGSTELAEVAAALLAHHPSERPSSADVLKTGMPQAEMRKMLNDRQKGGGNKVDARAGDDAYTRGVDARNFMDNGTNATSNAPLPSARHKHMPRSARSASPNVVHGARVCDDTAK